MSIKDVYSLFDVSDLKEAESAALDAVIAGKAPDGQAFTRDDYNVVKGIIDARRAELNPPKAGAPSMGIKVSEKGAVSVYGLQRFPVTLYAPGWIRLICGDGTTKDSPAFKTSAHPVITFIRDNMAKISWERASKAAELAQLNRLL
jgi:hypothetical protein